LDRRAVGHTIDVIPLTAIKENLFKVTVIADENLSRRLDRIARILHNPRKGCFFDSEAQGVYNVIRFEMSDFHDVPRRGK
jgi:hypothetical protein